MSAGAGVVAALVAGADGVADPAADEVASAVRLLSEQRLTTVALAKDCVVVHGAPARFHGLGRIASEALVFVAACGDPIGADRFGVFAGLIALNTTKARQVTITDKLR